MAKRKRRGGARRSFKRGARRKARVAQGRAKERRAVKRALKDFGVTGKIKNERLRSLISDASNGKTSPLNEAAVRSFWAFTRDIWNKDGIPADKRYEAIMRHYGTNNLSEAVGLALIDAKRKFELETGREFELGRYSVNRMFGAGFFSVAQ